MIAEKDNLDYAWDKEVPSGQQPERGDEQEEQDNIDVLKEKGEPVKFEYDIGPDLGIPKQDTEDAIKLYEMPENEYRHLMRSLNVYLRMKFVNDTLRVIKTSENQVVGLVGVKAIGSIAEAGKSISDTVKQSNELTELELIRELRNRRLEERKGKGFKVIG
ncbi:hypothetical protein LOTGIDRAFT_157163 [Lottia gigantea]|uniref:Uncharacterized protein n=1 Tax=Lottia gigantea TaxID=225164 RepID=V4AWX9_LOTGI|nr:hypothetical protein LOTGIDRAFT_157163 [Lottia gigantea]ESP02033.1 hypothetical protein LOTGIDRAFT_157163 [Lottia gigantea]